MSRKRRFAGSLIIPGLLGAGTSALVQAALKELQPAASPTVPVQRYGWEDDALEDRAIINGIQRLMVEEAITGREVNQLIKSGVLSDRVIFLLGDIHDPMAMRNMEPGEDPTELLSILERANRNAGYKAHKEKNLNS